jgi:hypothetical protein
MLKRFMWFGEIAEIDYYLQHVGLSVRRDGKSRLPQGLHEFWFSRIFWKFFKKI